MASQETIDENFIPTLFPSSPGTFPHEMNCYGDDDYIDTTFTDDMMFRERSFPAVFYVAIVIQLAAVLVSAATVVALLIPLLIQLKKGTGSLQRRRQKDPSYSTYNLYLVYLALIDLANFIPVIAAEVMAISGRSRYGFYSSIEWFFDRKFQVCSNMISIEVVVNLPYTMANLWMNAIIAYQILILLHKSYSGQRITQPSITRVNLHGGGVFLFSLGLGIFLHFNRVNGNMSWGWRIFVLATTMVPFTFVIGVTILIQCRGYMPVANGSSPRDNGVRGLAFYFFRIAMVFTVIWLPIVVVGAVYGYIEYVPYIIAVMLMAIQPIMTFCMILSKPDVRKYVKDLVTLITCSCSKKNNEGKQNKNERDPTRRTRRTTSLTILGYEFPRDADDDSNSIDVDANVDAEEGVDIDVSIFFGGPIDYDDDDEDGDNQVDGDTNVDIDAGVATVIMGEETSEKKKKKSKNKNTKDPEDSGVNGRT